MEKIIARLERIQTKNITDWEKGFMESLLGQVNKGHKLSQKQLEILSKTENKHSDEAVAKRNAWQAQWDDKKQEIAVICAHYYLGAGYFSDLARNLISNEKFIPTEKQFNAMCKNKYAQKVIDATFAEPKYEVGSMVSIRKTCGADAYLGRYPLRQMVEAPVIIVGVGNKPVLSASKGAKVYQILPIGTAEAYYIEERHLKRFKKPKKRSDQIGSQDEILF